MRRLPASARISLAAAALLVAPTTGVSSAATAGRPATLAAPVIHEPFTALPCSGAPEHRSTLEQTGCAEQQILATDMKIDVLNRSIFAKLGDDRARRRFIAGHEAWLAYRHAYCLSRSDVFEGGTEAGVLDAECVAAVSSRHVIDLRVFLSDLGTG